MGKIGGNTEEGPVPVDSRVYSPPAGPDARQGTAGATGRVPGLDGIRGFAVLLVVLSHAHVPFFGPGGIAGVTTFFVLSGFLITGLLLKEHRRTGRIDLLAFWGRRALRLLPALLVFLGVITVLYLTLGWATRSQMTEVLRPVLLYYGNIHIAVGGVLDPFRHTWSLAVEEQFYLVWPLLLTAALFPLRARGSRAAILFAGLVVLTVASAGWRLYQGLHLGEPDVRWLPHTTVFSMTAGGALAVLFDNGWRPGRWALPAGLIALSAYFWLPVALLGPSPWILGPVVYSVFALVLIVSVLGTSSTPLTWEPLRWTGKVSYGWYLWHFPVMYTLMNNPDSVVHYTVALAMVVVVSLGISGISWHYLEEPVQRRFRHRLERVRLAPEAPETPAAVGTSPAPTPAPPEPALPVPDRDLVIDLTDRERLRSTSGSASADR
jgi:peptidoglycan/LPS O-acetylase OafA/YrhL